MICSIRNLAVLWLLLASAMALAQDRQFAEPFSLSQPMLRYERASAMINDGQPVVRLDVWANGQALVWFHEVRRHPGEYSFSVAPDQLAALRSAIGNLEVSDFDRVAIEKAQSSIEQERRLAASKSGESTTLVAVSDDTFSRFGINPDGISAKVESRNAISLTNLPQVSRQYKSIDALQRWQQIETLALENILLGQKVAEEVRNEVR